MIKSVEIYKEAQKYELLMMRIYNYKKSSLSNGAHCCYMRNAIDSELGKSNVKHLGNFDKQFSKVKYYLLHAFLKMIHDTDDQIQKTVVSALFNMTKKSQSTYELSIVIKIANSTKVHQKNG